MRDSQTGTDGEKNRDRQTGRQAGRHTKIDRDRQTDRQRHRERQRDRDRGRDRFLIDNAKLRPVSHIRRKNKSLRNK